MKRKEQKQQTRDKLFRTSLELFVQKGYDNVAVDEIVQKAGASKGSFYHHFASKSAVLLDYGHTVHNELLERLRISVLQTPETAEDGKIEIFFSLLNEFTIQNAEGLKLFFEHTASLPGGQSALSPIADELRIMLGMLIEDEKTANRAASDTESARLAGYMIELYYYELRKSLRELESREFPGQFLNRADGMLQLFFCGFRR